MMNFSFVKREALLLKNGASENVRQQTRRNRILKKNSKVTREKLWNICRNTITVAKMFILDVYGSPRNAQK